MPSEWEDDESEFFEDYDGPKPRPNASEGIKFALAISATLMLILASSLLFDW